MALWAYAEKQMGVRQNCTAVYGPSLLTVCRTYDLTISLGFHVTYCLCAVAMVRIYMPLSLHPLPHSKFSLRKWQHSSACQLSCMLVCVL